ncbi:MAG TPA: hypothetical protein VFH61_12455 [Thermoleophilia bacterium]|nr:hypothetical protein [Thermoleophilia bacterium]
MNFSDLFARIRKELPDDIDDKTIELVERTAAAAAILVARAAEGQEVERDLLHVKAQAANLSAEYLTKVLTKVREWVLEAVTKVVVGIA